MRRQMFACPRCGWQNIAGQQFCANCGVGLFSGGSQQAFGPQQVYSCPVCHQPVVYGVGFCGNCRTPLNWPTQQVQPPPAYQQQGTSYQHAQMEPEKKKKNVWLIGCLGLIGAVILVGGIAFAVDTLSKGAPSSTQSATMSVAEIKNGAITISYDDLMRNNKQYVGKIAYYRGGIVQVSESYGDKYVLRIATKKGEYLGYIEDVIWVNYQGTRLLEDDIVDMWGKVMGLKSYTALLGNTVTIPELNSLHLELVTKAGTESPTETPPVAGAKGNVIIRYSGTTVNQVGEWNKASPGYTYLILDLNIKNEDCDSFAVNSFNLNVIVNGVKYNSEFFGNLSNELKSVTLLPGGISSGKVGFEVPVGTSSYQPTYETWGDGCIIEWIKE